ncbi:DUF2493 domain-containing protein [Silicimonas algicola]|uniref:Uncharacterized protein DUF2493 n=1 Tax=Silicimonas algicola TaxID=1826607 RepID=A0A316G9N7_9RHOB|nr:SLOG family protein [Silicimonas algicola]AZQ67971.1 DUF2493 domain-containing protein [Silicimonas algicola]PWK57588.1 uncharacterized protein DUF2493 [Silicimonas algicola]
MKGYAVCAVCGAGESQLIDEMCSAGPQQRIQICGGRDYNNWDRVQEVMAPFRDRDVFIIQGGARGADFLGKVWAVLYAAGHREFRAAWKTQGRSAGARRNTEMLVVGKPTLVIAFPGGPGTADMIYQSIGKKVPVREISP